MAYRLVNKGPHSPHGDFYWIVDAEIRYNRTS